MNGGPRALVVVCSCPVRTSHTSTGRSASLARSERLMQCNDKPMAHDPRRQANEVGAAEATAIAHGNFQLNNTLREARLAPGIAGPGVEPDQLQQGAATVATGVFYEL